MQYVLSNEEMRAADEYTIRELGVPSIELMERAADGLLAAAKGMVGVGARAVCVCGGGNNGGDGFALARKLNECGMRATAVFFAERTTAENDYEREAFLASGGTIERSVPRERVELVVDCLLGTGFHGVPCGDYAEAIEDINALRERGAKVLAADIPSGVNGNDGRVTGVAVRADVTLCIGEFKRGVFLGDGIDYAGKPLRVDIGIRLPDDRYATLASDAEVRAALPKRKRNSHKGTYKRAAVVAGSEEYSGAAYLSTAACLRSGVGYTTLFTPSAVFDRAVWRLPEALLKSTNDGGRVAFTDDVLRLIAQNDCVAYGMGLGNSRETAEGALWLLHSYSGRLILDADALNALAAYAEDLDDVFRSARATTVLTPHVKEFARLTGKSTEEILRAPIDYARVYAARWKVTILLKNAVSVLTDGEKTTLLTVGNSGQAKGGSGDVLSGLAAGVCAYAESAFDGVLAAAYVSGAAADFAKARLGEYAMKATDCIDELGRAFLAFAEDTNEECGKA